MDNSNLGKSSTGIEANVAGLLCYLLGWITGLVFYLIEKDNKFVRFHAVQSMAVFGSLTVLSLILPVIPVLGWALIPVVYIAQLALWILMMVKAYQGAKLKLPIAGDVAEKYS